MSVSMIVTATVAARLLRVTCWNAQLLPTLRPYLQRLSAASACVMWLWYQLSLFN